MDETEKNNEPQILHGDTAASKEQRRSKLNELNPTDLIPSELASIPGIKGQINILSQKTDRSISYVITDAAKMRLDQIEDAFQYFEENELETHPGLKMKGNQYARPLVHGSIREISPDMLFCGIVETHPALRGKGAGVAFQENLAEIAKKLGYKFLTGYQNDPETARFFLNRGRYLVEEVREEFQEEFKALKAQENDESVFYTVKFTNPEDIIKYIKPERIDTDAENKIEFKEKRLALISIFYELSSSFEEMKEKEKDESGLDRLITVMTDLNNQLPTKDQHTAPKLSTDDANLILKLKVLFQHLKNNSSTIIRELTLTQLEALKKQEED